MKEESSELYALPATILSKRVVSTPHIITHKPTPNQLEDTELPSVVGYRIRLRDPDMDKENERLIKRQKVRGG
jgi:hypothetical protein